MKTFSLLIAILFTSTPASTGTVPASPSVAAPKTVEIGSWKGEWFVLLEKPALYCNYGYELYSCPQLDACREAVDTALFTKYHRPKCGKVNGHRLKAVSIVPQGNEWLVAFEDSLVGKKMYAKTSNGVCHEVAYEPDLDGARARWLGKTVFSARGFITAFKDGKTSSIKVDLRDSLRVAGVRFGLTPLPTKPLWLMVETAKGENGAIPLYYSWTNVKKDLRHEGNPWDDDIFESNPGVGHTFDTVTWNLINAHNVRVGMSRDQIRLSWGRPHRRSSEAYNGASRECWVYERQHLYFDDKELIAIEENQLAPIEHGKRK
jgi:hypothetical protein